MTRYKDREIEIEKMCHLKTTTVPVIGGALGMIKKGTHRHINKIPGSPRQYESKKLHFSELLIALGEYYKCDWKKQHPKGAEKKKP